MPGARLTFDRGGLLIRGLPADAEALRIPGVAWDSAAAGHRAPVIAYFAIAAALRAGGVPLSDDGPGETSVVMSGFRATASPPSAPCHAAGDEFKRTA